MDRQPPQNSAFLPQFHGRGDGIYDFGDWPLLKGLENVHDECQVAEAVGFLLEL